MLALGSLTLALLAISCGQAGTKAPDSEGLSRTDDQREVTVKVTWNGRGDPPAFEVVLDTHSVDLDSYDLGLTSVLKTGRGQELAPTGWDAEKGGHHRSGNLLFGSLDQKELSGDHLELVIKDINGVPERSFHWDSD